MEEEWEDEGADADIDTSTGTGTEEWGEEDILYLETDEEEELAEFDDD